MKRIFICLILSITVIACGQLGYKSSTSSFSTQQPITYPTITKNITPTDQNVSACIPSNTHRIQARVQHVVDGDTIRVLIDGESYPVRYIGIDTPEDTETVEYFGAEATAKNIELVAGKTVTLIEDVSEVDRYGRLLRYVLVDDLFVNLALVAQGYAHAVTYPPDVSCNTTLQQAEHEAKTNLQGLWAIP